MHLIHECRTSGLGDKDWCEQHGIPISTFYTKITRLRKKACEVPAANHHSIRETQQVVPLQLIDETDGMYENAAINEVVLCLIREYPLLRRKQIRKRNIRIFPFSLPPHCFYIFTEHHKMKTLIYSPHSS